VFLWSLGWPVYFSGFRHWRTASLAGHLDCRWAFAHPASQLVFRRLSVVTCATLLRSTGLLPCMIPHSTRAKWFVMPGLAEQLRPWISDSKRTWTQFPRSCHHQSPPSSRLFGTPSIDWQPQNPLWLTSCAGLRFIAVTSRTLPQSARVTRPCGLLLAYSLSGTSNPLQSLFPAQLQLAADLRQQLRQLGCDAEFWIKLAPNSKTSVHSADLFCLQNLRECASVAL